MATTLFSLNTVPKQTKLQFLWNRREGSVKLRTNTSFVCKFNDWCGWLAKGSTGDITQRRRRRRRRDGVKGHAIDSLADCFGLTSTGVISYSADYLLMTDVIG